MSGVDHAHDAQAASSHHEDAHGDGHGHGEESLGPIDWRAWGAAVLGIASAVAVVGALYVTIRPA
jgi:hypothetical protein